METQKKKGLVQMIAGAVGLVISVVGIVFGATLRGRIKPVVIATGVLGLALSGWVFFTGWKNYAINMFGYTKMPTSFVAENGETLTEMIVKVGVPVISVRDKSALLDAMKKRGNFVLWLPCQKGGAWWKPSAYFYTRWTLPSADVTCPTGRKLIDYAENS